MQNLTETDTFPWRTLPGRDYHAPDVYAADLDRVFAPSWVCVGRAETITEPGSYLTPEVSGEQLIVIRGKDGQLRAFANSCRHRGTLLLEGTGTVKGAIRCPYHSWTYGFDGTLLGSPNVKAEDGLDREAYGLWPVPLEEWDGFVFVNLDGTAAPLAEMLATVPDSPVELSRYGIGELRIGATREYDVAANWKIVIENYHECLHCPVVHPELVKIVPLYRHGEVEEEGQTLGNSMGHGLTSFTASGLSSLPRLPGLTDEDEHTFYGAYLPPNLILNYHSETVNAVTVHPAGPERTIVKSAFLFRPETMAAEGFDPSEVVDFRDLVARQDWSVCELAQRGLRSRFFDSGIYPRQERGIATLNQRYVAQRDGLRGAVH
ncbi:MAG: glycine betaine catabolism [Actinomycetota bacterium]|jgi:Rieske 2Fe-2S family protein|nr:glycine betaine catabolism [Actinomycetota bacterium]